MPFHPDQYQARQHWLPEDIPDCRWPSDNADEIPLLRLDLAANALDMPLTMWGTVRRTRMLGGTIGFYVDDYRFTRLWLDPSPILNTACPTIIEPNFSITDQTPVAVARYRIYQKRQLARTWQELGGMRVFVDLNVGERHQQLNLLGVPQGWRSYATRGYRDRLALTEQEYELACAHRGSADVLFLVYGGGAAVEALARERGWIWIPEQRTVVRERGALRSKERG